MQAVAMNRADEAASLVRFHPATSRDRYTLVADVSIGRSPPCEIMILSDLISRRHAHLERAGDSWRIRDLDSANGLYVNGERVRSRLLRDGDIVRLGATLLRFEVRPPCQGLALVDDEMVGPSLGPLCTLLRRAAQVSAPVILIGPPGAGKSVAARYLHRMRKSGPQLVQVDCTAASCQELEQAVRQATGGTLFLRRVGSLSSANQQRVARQLDPSTLLVVSTREPLSHLEPQLKARLADAVEIEVPPLSQRRQDIPDLVLHFLRTGPARRVTVEAMERLCCTDWSDNVRELEQAVARALARIPDGALLDVECLGDKQCDDAAAQLMEALRRHRGDVNAAAADFSLSRSQLYRRAQKLGIRVADFRG